MVIGDWDQATETLQRVLQQNERSMDALRLNVLLLVTQKADDPALIEQLNLMFNSMERYENTNAKLYFETARALGRLVGQRTQILRLLTQLCHRAVTLDPLNAAYAVELARQQCMLGDHYGAMETYRNAGQSDETNVAALYGTIYCQVIIGEFEDAEQQLDFLIDISDSITHSSQVPFLKALLAWRHRGDANEHLRLLQQTESIHFESISSHSASNIFEYYAMLDPDFLIQIAKEYLVHSPFWESLDGMSIPRLNMPQAAVGHGIKMLERVITKVPGLIEAYLLIARSKFVLGELGAAKRALNTALNCDHRSASVHLTMAKLELASNNHRGAQNALEEAVACDFKVRKLPAYALVKAGLCSKADNHEEAVRWLESALKISGVRDVKQSSSNPLPLSERVAIFVTLADVFVTLDRLNEASSILAEAQARFRGTPEEIRIIMSHSSLAVKRNDFDKAVRMLSDVPPSSPAFVDALQMKANLYLTVKHDKRAFVHCFQDLLAIRPTAEAHEQLGGAYMHIQAPDAAIDAFSQARDISPNKVSLTPKIGKALVSTHEYSKATSYYEAALQIHPDDVSLCHDLAKLYMKLKKYESTIQVLEHAIEVTDSSMDLTKLAQKVQLLLTLAKVHTCILENKLSEDRVSVDPIFSTLIKARDLQQKIIEHVSSVGAPEISNKHNKIMAEIHCNLARIQNKGKSSKSAVVSYQQALKFDTAAFRRIYVRRRLRD